jgi:tetratricopeptide (TPR) repeat protein
MESDNKLRHLAFFSELATLDESNSDWREVTAGLVTLRLVDAWLEEGKSVVCGDSWSVSAVREAISDIDNGRPARGILKSIVDVMESSDEVDVHTVVPRLMAYASNLDFEAKWRLAIDVYRTIIGHTEPFDDTDSVVAAHLRLGFCLRQTGDIGESSEAYATAGQVAQSVGDMMGVLRARIGDAKIAMLKGNLPHAEAILDSTIADAAVHGIKTVESMALHDRASAAGLRGDYELAVRLAYEALSKTDEMNRDRDRILHDISTAFYRMGVRTAARDGFLVLAATAQEQYIKWASSIQLLAISADDSIGPVFERYRRELGSQPLPPALLAEFQFHAGRGYRLLGQLDESADWLDEAMSSAERYGLNQLLFETENEIQALKYETARREAPKSAPALSPSIGKIVEAVREMREAVTVG